ncbi:trypsin-like serine protease [Nonomuraea sp. MCN248]|uniref:Trypsin-like serine protease n=1 Tax=Nonomuraea corallina TaxID=2989783 RepID=A0ABT4SCH6_9ACTN|nr:trypsin-like serine protease [Nonomuraea corallina]MDA0634913.1 trypsin-like serine protease [Nonomuraea corallina]
MIPRAKHLLAAAVSGALLMLPAFQGTAGATASQVFAVSLAKSKAEVQKVADYWKPERLRKAETYSPAAPPSGAPKAGGGSVNVPAQRIAALRKKAGPVNAVAPRQGAASTVGKVFFRLGGKEFWCSAAAVAAANRSVVATAAHCAYDPRRGEAADSWIFVPDPGAAGATPHGVYVGSSISMHEDWPGKNDYDYDYAFVTVHRGFTWVKQGNAYIAKDVGRLQDNVGGLGLELSRKPPMAQVHAFGYPAGPQPDGSQPFNGQTLRSCVGATRKTIAPGLDLDHGVQLSPCNFSKGASGGPWITGLRANLGALIGVNSLTWNRDAKGEFDAVSSPYLGPVAGDVYRHAAAQTTPANVM